VREIRHLNEGWYFKPFDLKDIESFDPTQSVSVSIPHEGVKLPYHYFDETITQQVFTYHKEFFIESALEGKIISIRFEGVAHQASLYLNGRFITKHIGGYTPFEAILNDHISFGQLNQICVVVDGNEDPDTPPFGGVVDYLGYVGIYREVALILKDPIHIQDVYIKADREGMIAEVKVSLEAALKIQLIDPKGQIVYDITMPKAMSHVIKTSPTPLWIWDIESPHLYTLKTICETDELSTRFGFRTIAFKPDGFYLNDRLLKLRGLNRHQSYPYVGYAMPKRLQQQDADILKYELGLNIVRSSHYPPSKHFIERCDEIGLLLFEELPGWQHIGQQAFIENALNALQEMILRDRNHPSIILWVFRINESPDHQDFYTRSNALARTLDPSRPTGGVRNFAKSEFLEDVYTYNDFSHTGTNAGVMKKSKITKQVPYLVTEHNGHMFPTKKFDPESKRVDHALRHMNVLNAALNPNEPIAGAIGWCMSDYNTHKEFGSGDKICYHGVLDMDRLPKLASYGYQSQHQNQPFMRIASTMQNGEYAGGFLEKVVIFTNVDFVKLYRNDALIDTYYPDIEHYKYLPHPPIVISDFIGKTLMEKEHMKEKDANKTKRILRKIQKDGNHLPIWNQLQMLWLLKKYHLSLNDGVRMYFEYTSGWGSKETIYRFEGYIDQQCVVKEIIESHKTSQYNLTGEDTMVIAETYDVLRLVVQKTNEHGKTLDFAMDGFAVQVEGPIELISPSISNLNGGSRAIYIRSKALGEAKVWVHFDGISLSKNIRIILY
jgi:beta-galactosidase